MQSVKLGNPPLSAEYTAQAPRVAAVDFYKPFWMFFMGSFAGFFFETIYCFIRLGRFEYRSSLIFFPFTAVYGLGVLFLYMGLQRIEKIKTFEVFLYGMIAGTVLEYMCSFIQEKLFGTVSWDYSKAFLNINGRVCLQLSMIWGLLAMMWVIGIHPLFEAVISKIPPRPYKILARVLAVIVTINIIISAAAVTRWVARLDGAPARGAITATLDRFFPNEFMSKIYPNMRFRN